MSLSDKRSTSIVIKPVLLVLLSSVLAFFVACDSGGSRSGGAVSDTKLNEFAKQCDLVLPPSAKALHYKFYPGMDSVTHATIKMPAADFPAFFKASGLDVDITNTDRPSSLPAKFGSFVPKMPTKFREGQKSLPRDTFLNVLVDEDSPTTVLVHLVWFEV